MNTSNTPILPFAEAVNEQLLPHFSRFQSETQNHLQNFGQEGSGNTGLPHVTRAFRKAGFNFEDTQSHLFELYLQRYPESAERDIRRACELAWDLRDTGLDEPKENSSLEPKSKTQKGSATKVKKWSYKPQPNTRKRNFYRMITGVAPMVEDHSLRRIGAEEFLKDVHPADARVVISKERRGKSHNLLISELAQLNLGSELYCFTIANPVLAKIGVSQEGNPSKRSKDICTPEEDVNIFVLENDERTREEQLQFAQKLVDLGFPVIAVIDAQNKSLHIWLSVTGLTATEKNNLRSFFVHCGFDPAGLRVSQLVRLVGGNRDGDKSRRQSLIYYNKKMIGAKLSKSKIQALDISSFTKEEDEALSDLDEADRFLHYLGGRFICVGKLGWYEFNGHIWQPVHKEAVGQCFMDYVRQERTAGYIERTRHLSVKRRIVDILKLVEIELTQNVTFDTKPMLVGLKNGVLDLETGQLRQGKPTDYISQLMNVSYAPDAECPHFEAFLERIFRNHICLVPYMQKLLGYTLTGLVSEQKMFFLYGGGSNGKTTLMNVIQGIMGDYARKVQQGSYLVSKKSSSETALEYVGARFAYGEEMPQSAKMDEAAVKNLTGGDKILYKKLYNDHKEATPTHKLFLFGNYKPTVSGCDHGIWRRIVIIPFTETITDEEKKTELPELLKAEFSGILNWLIKGVAKYLKEGLEQPDIINDAVAEYKSDEDIFGEFITECLDLSDPKERTLKTDVFDAYKKWCNNDNTLFKSRTNLYKALRERGIHPISNNYPLALREEALVDNDLFSR